MREKVILKTSLRNSGNVFLSGNAKSVSKMFIFAFRLSFEQQKYEHHYLNSRLAFLIQYWKYNFSSKMKVYTLYFLQLLLMKGK